MQFPAIVFGLLSFDSVLAQDSVEIHQRDAKLFSNRYTFYSNKTFVHLFTTDDAQIWFGKGTFTDRFGLRLLRFGDVDASFKTHALVIHYEANFRRKLYFCRGLFRSKDFYHTTKRRWVEYDKGRQYSHKQILPASESYRPTPTA